MFEEDRYNTYTNSKIFYHIILLISFVVAIKLLPWASTQVNKYVENTLLQTSLPYVLVYIGAIYILPNLGFMIYTQIAKE